MVRLPLLDSKRKSELPKAKNAHDTENAKVENLNLTCDLKTKTVF